MTQTRRLAAILAADVAGYSRLMGADEEGTLERLKALRHELVDPKIVEHRGRIVKTTGAGLLVEFASVVDAVRCAVAVQQAMPERNTGVAADNRIELCIGINLGDVIVEGDDLRDEHRTSVARSSNRIPVDFGELHSAAANQLGGDPADPVRDGSAVVLPGL
jgi:adenylate cyclase